jgi:3-hydroxyisobutyrate dehydrogenase-like beta-hydroxyacid dehydrogenase
MGSFDRPRKPVLGRTAGVIRSTRIGFIGLGRMGSAIAGRLVSNRMDLCIVPGPRRSGVDAARAAGAQVLDTPRALARACAIVFTCLPSAHDVVAVTEGPDGLLAASRPDFAHVDLTSSDPAATLRLAHSYAALGVDFLDAAISGPPEKAARGEIALLVGGDPAAVARLRPVLSMIAASVEHLGPVAMGHRAKALMAAYGVATANAAAEVIALAQAAGIDAGRFAALVAATGMDSATFQAMAAAVAGDQGATRRLTIASAAKDTRHAHDMSVAQGMACRMIAASLATLDDAVAAGAGDAFVTELGRLLVRRPAD